METPKTPSPLQSAVIAIVLGTFLIVVAVFFDPIGTSPDTGVFELGVFGTKMLIGGMGLVFVIAGIIDAIKSLKGVDVP